MNYPITERVYFTDCERMLDKACIVAMIPSENNQLALILDKTIFHPQGGGQPYDQGIIASAKGATFVVKQVRAEQDVIYHIGELTQASLVPGDTVDLIVDAERRMLHSKIHTGGHLIDLALSQLGVCLTPTKGFHFPEGPYIEYEGVLDEQTKDLLMNSLELEIQKIIDENRPIHIKMVSYSKLKTLSTFIHPSLSQEKPCRVMHVEGFFAIPCGGTHLAFTGKLKFVKIGKITLKKGMIRISYSVD